MRARRSIWHSAMFNLEPEGCYHCTQSKVIGPTPFWVSMEHRWTFLKPFWLSANIAMLNEVGPIEWHFSSNSTKEYNTAPQHTHTRTHTHTTTTTTTTTTTHPPTLCHNSKFGLFCGHHQSFQVYVTKGPCILCIKNGSDTFRHTQERGHYQSWQDIPLDWKAADWW